MQQQQQNSEMSVDTYSGDHPKYVEKPCSGVAYVILFFSSLKN
jgi:hypothetical protein